MERKKILNVGYGKKRLYDLCKNGELSSRLLYGIIQLEELYEVEHVSLDSSGFFMFISNNMKVLKNSDIIFMSYLYEAPLSLIVLLKSFGFFRRRKIVVISHKKLSNETGFKSLYYKRIYKSIDVVFFHSELNLAESVEAKIVDCKKCKFLYWGDDLHYIDNIFNHSDGTYFLSSGREYRDFHLLIDVFSSINSSLKIYTNKANYDIDYGYLDYFQNKLDNVDIVYVDRSNTTTNFLVQKTADCLCVVIPLMKEFIDYCVGLTSIVEAMALGKPIISTWNPYSPVDIEKEGIGFWVDSRDSWIRAIQRIQNNPKEAKQMGTKARELAEKRFNINYTAMMLDDVFRNLFI